MNDIYPDAVLETLKSGARPQKQRNLDIVHAVCRDMHGLGSRDFSLATVGRMSEERNGMSRNALYNKTSEDFRTLIGAWGTFAGEPARKQAASLKPLAEEDLLRRIDDPALRALLAAWAGTRYAGRASNAGAIPTGQSHRQRNRLPAQGYLARFPGPGRLARRSGWADRQHKRENYPRCRFRQCHPQINRHITFASGYASDLNYHSRSPSSRAYGRVALFATHPRFLSFPVISRLMAAFGFGG
jgi:hypothetical protein